MKYKRILKLVGYKHIYTRSEWLPALYWGQSCGALDKIWCTMQQIILW